MATHVQILSAKVVGSLMLCAFVSDGLALDPNKAIAQYQQAVWTEREGLPQGSVQAITQTHDGYLWMGTRDGLARFDGVTFTVFRAETTAGLPANDIRALREDQAGRLWIGTFNGGLSCYSRGEFRSFPMKDGLPSNGVLDIIEDRNGILWLGTWGGIARIEAGKIVACRRPDGLIGYNGLSLCEDRRGCIWVATEAAVHQWTGQRFEAVTNLNEMPESPARQVYAGRDGTMWFATAGDGLFSVHDGSAKRYTKRDGLPDNKVRTVLEDRHGNVWIGTWSGLCRLHNQTVATLTKQDGLPHDYVECLYEDREGSLWIGTRGGGLARLRDARVSTYTTREGLAHNFAKCVFQDREGAVWMGTHGGGLSRHQNGRFTNFGNEHGLPSLFVWAVAEDAHGDFWVGTARPPTVNLFKDGKFTPYTAQKGLTMRHGVRVIAADRDGSLWIGGDGGGLCHFQNGTFKCFTTADGLPSNLIRAIHQDRSGDLWIGTNDGLCRYRQGKFGKFSTEDGLAHNAVYAVLEDSEGVLWFGTQDGLSRFVEGRFRSYTTRHGLFHNVIYQILEDREHRLWMSSNRGIFSIVRDAFADFDRGKIRALPCVAYGVADGMRAAQCEGGTQPAGCQAADSTLWFPTANGVAVIDPNKLATDRTAPPVLVEEVWIGKERLDLRSPVKLPRGAREFLFHYTALSFAAPEKVRFRYRLEGVDRDWVEAETRRSAFYHEVPPGNHRFRVIACNDDGIWNEAGASFAFYVPPHFYQTIWFFALCAALLGVAGWSFHRRRMARAKAQFSMVLAERSRIARALHDTLAQGFAGIAFQLEAVADKLDEAPKQAQQHLNLALSMVRHSLVEARRSVMNLRSAALESCDLASALAETARQMMADRSVDVNVQTNGSPRMLAPKVEDNLLRVGQEAITNSLKHSRATQIRVVLDYQATFVRLSVHDNGQGFEPNGLLTANGGHFGIVGMRERTKQIGGKIEIRSSPGTGAHVTLEIATHQPAEPTD